MGMLCDVLVISATDVITQFPEARLTSGVPAAATVISTARDVTSATVNWLDVTQSAAQHLHWPLQEFGLDLT